MNGQSQKQQDNSIYLKHTIPAEMTSSIRRLTIITSIIVPISPKLCISLSFSIEDPISVSSIVQ